MSGPATQFVPTAEQSAIVTAVTGDWSAEVIKVDSFAGASKTSSLLLCAKALPYSEKVLYIAFSRPICDEARATFPKNVTCKTNHGLAWFGYGDEYAKAGKLLVKGDVHPSSLRQIPEFEDIAENDHLDMILKTVKGYLITADEHIGPRHIPVDAPVIRPAEREMAPQGGLDLDTRVPEEEVLRLANILWKRMRDLEDMTAKMTQDGYLKLFQLSKPRLSFRRIWLDEGQDSNPVILDIVMRQAPHCQITIVGDKHQSIFKFRGAVDAMQGVHSSRVFTLSKSFRFGPAIAHIADTMLKIQGETTRLVGFEGKAHSSLGEFPLDESHAFLTRTNASAIAEAIKWAEQGRKLTFIGGIEGYPFRLLSDVYNLYKGKHHSIESVDIRTYKHFEELRNKVANRGGQEKSLVAAVETYQDKVPDLVSQVEELHEPDWRKGDLIISTVHKAKGYGFPRVRMADDFYDFFADDGSADPRLHSDETVEERNIFYVGVTRAMDTLWPNRSLRKIIRFAPAYLVQRQVELDALRRGEAPVVRPIKPITGFHLRDIGANLMLYSSQNAPADWLVLDCVGGGIETLGNLATAGNEANVGGRELLPDESADVALIYAVLTVPSPRQSYQSLVAAEPAPASLDVMAVEDAETPMLPLPVYLQDDELPNQIEPASEVVGSTP